MLAVESRDVIAPTPTGGPGLRLYRVLDPDGKAVAEASRYLSESQPGRFPGPNPVSLERETLPHLGMGTYWMCEKTDGVRMAMILCRFRGLNVCALMDRAMTVYLCPLQRIPTALFQGSVIDGELTFDKASKAWVYLAFDAVTLCGMPVKQKPLSTRLSTLRRAWTAYSPAPKEDPLEFRVKDYVPATSEGVPALNAAIERYNVDGVVFTPEDAPVVFGKHVGLFKLKKKHTVDFLVGTRGELSVYEGRKHTRVGRFAKGHAALKGSIVECEYAADDQWTLVHVRTDKRTANDMLTYQKTMINIREQLTLKDALDACSSHPINNPTITNPTINNIDIMAPI